MVSQELDADAVQLTESAPKHRSAAIQGIVFWLTLAIICVTAFALAGNRPTAWIALSLAVLSLFAVQLVYDLAAPPDRTDRAFLVTILVAWSLVVAWAIVQCLPALIPGWSHPAWEAAMVSPGRISVDPVATAQGALRLITYACIFWIGYRAGARRGRARAFVTMIAVWVLLTALYGLAALWAGVNPITGPSAYPGVVTSSFISRNAYALYAGLGMLAATAGVGLIVRRELSHLPPNMSAAPIRVADVVISHGWFLVLAGIVLAVTVVMTESRGGTFAAAVGMCVMIALITYERGSVGKMLAWSVGLPAVLLLIGLWVTSHVSSAGAEGLAGRIALEDPSQDARWGIYGLLIEGIASRPLLGHGLGAFQDGFRQFLTADFGASEWDRAHNTFLQSAFELGLPAAALMFFALGVIAVRLLHGVWHRSRGRAIPAFALATLAAAGVHSLIDFGPEMPATAALIAMILGVGTAQCHRPKKVTRRAQFT
ncbi:O-antigen ligase family protein [Limibaculum sp. M0105]|uniref:O-antigen ligase family protein n=1 Tax=Thermohalobaculum xanthum TaxID=2753746 RepID=A0A8J7M5R9_9RHOB|nr:O-antigen ligase family protein [Thermohalobaculum xanthum]MBK0398725.1 O-antigen ligase family protein [Thermohalobaculum xanthum]